MKKKKPGRPVDQAGDEPFDGQLPVASSTECTGLIPSAPASDGQADFYGEIYDIPSAKSDREAAHEMQRPPVEAPPERPGRP